MLQRIRRFIDESWSELKKVTWPTREQTVNLTFLVFLVSLVVGLFISFFDAIFTAGLDFIGKLG
jgi:preprotein translocase subunit SecE